MCVLIRHAVAFDLYNHQNTYHYTFRRTDVQEMMIFANIRKRLILVVIHCIPTTYTNCYFINVLVVLTISLIELLK